MVRIASNSPLAGVINLGDNIQKVNDNSLVRPDDLVNIIMMSSKKVHFLIESNGQTKTVDIEI